MLPSPSSTLNACFIQCLFIVKYVLTYIYVASSRRSMKAPERVPLPPPAGSHDAYSYGTKSFNKPTTSSSYPPYETAHTSPPAAPSSSAYDNQVNFHKPQICMLVDLLISYFCGQKLYFLVSCWHFCLQVCPICLVNPKDMAFGCGHQVRHQRTLPLSVHYFSTLFLILGISLYLFGACVETSVSSSFLTKCLLCRPAVSVGKHCNHVQSVVLRSAQE